MVAAGRVMEAVGAGALGTVETVTILRPALAVGDSRYWQTNQIFANVLHRGFKVACGHVGSE